MELLGTALATGKNLGPDRYEETRSFCSVVALLGTALLAMGRNDGADCYNSALATAHKKKSRGSDDLFICGGRKQCIVGLSWGAASLQGAALLLLTTGMNTGTEEATLPDAGKKASFCSSSSLIWQFFWSGDWGGRECVRGW